MDKIILAKKIAFYILLVVIWQSISLSDIWPNNIFPSPYEVGEDLVYMASDGSLFFGIATTIVRLVVGLAIAIGGGIVLGVLMARIETINQTIGSLVLGLQSIPSIAWVPLAILWFGLTDTGIIFVTAIGAMFAVTINTYTGIKNIDPHYIEAARNMGAKGTHDDQVLRYLETHTYDQTMEHFQISRMTVARIKKRNKVRYMPNKIKIAICGVGNAASALIQGIEYYKSRSK
ncbi:MAG: ABC transporter permease subunit, partial [Nitrosopumilus sp.]